MGDPTFHVYTGKHLLDDQVESQSKSQSVRAKYNFNPQVELII